ncbi:MAG: NADH-quinone oxidoreductase subunit I, partial [Elusimicrobiota bacterium]
MIGYFSTIARNSKAVLQGHWITLKYMFKPSVTIHYPDEKLVPFERYRGALLFDAATCISCNLCVKACPSNCIALENAKNETGKKIAKVEWYSIDFGKCNFCRLCEEACPTKP